jgi:hypothetical protein
MFESRSVVKLIWIDAQPNLSAQPSRAYLQLGCLIWPGFYHLDFLEVFLVLGERVLLVLGILNAGCLYWVYILELCNCVAYPRLNYKNAPRERVAYRLAGHKFTFCWLWMHIWNIWNSCSCAQKAHYLVTTKLVTTLTKSIIGCRIESSKDHSCDEGCDESWTITGKSSRNGSPSPSSWEKIFPSLSPRTLMRKLFLPSPLPSGNLSLQKILYFKEI